MLGTCAVALVAQYAHGGNESIVCAYRLDVEVYVVEAAVFEERKHGVGVLIVDVDDGAEPVKL